MFEQAVLLNFRVNPLNNILHIVISFLSPIEKPYEIYQETILWEGSYRVCECSGGVVAVLPQHSCTVRSSIAAFRVADPGFKSLPEHPIFIFFCLSWY